MGSYSGYVHLAINGTGRAGGSDVNDAFYVIDNLQAGCQTQFVIHVWLGEEPVPLARLLAEGCPEFNPEHVYEVGIDLGTHQGPLRFGTGDGFTGDNSGELSIHLTPMAGPPKPGSTPVPERTPTGPYVFDEVAVAPARAPDRSVQMSYATPACPRDVPALRLREDSGIDDAVDLDVLYVARDPVYGYRQDKTFPDLGEMVTYTAYVANRGGVGTGEAESEVTVHWKMESPSEETLFEFRRTYKVSLPPHAVAKFKLGWNWQDGPNRLTFSVDPEDDIPEWTLANNSVELHTNALLVGLTFENSFYDWMNSVMNGEMDVGGFYWFTKDPSSPPHRPEVFGAESWAQRHVEQMNEYFRKAEDDYFGGVRYSLPRVALQAVPVVSDEEMASDNSGLPVRGTWGDLDLVWGFQSTFPQEHFPGECHTLGPQGAWTWLGHYNPNFRTIEDPLIHELGHHMALHHETEIYGAYDFVLGSTEILLQDGSLAIEPPHRFGGDVNEIFGVMQNGDYSLGLSRYAAHTLAYRFQPIAGRDVPSRVGALNGGGGNRMPIDLGSYWDDYGTDNVWDWVQHELPGEAVLTVVDGKGDPVPAAEIEIYKQTRLPEEALFPSNVPVPFSARWEGWFDPPASGEYHFLTYSLGNVRVSVDGRELINPDGSRGALRGDTKSMIAGREFRHGQHWTNPIVLDKSRRYPILIELDSYDVYGGKRLTVGYECLACPGGFSGLTEFQEGELWTVDGESRGVNATFWAAADYGADGNGPVAQGVVPSPKALPGDLMVFSDTPVISGVASHEGMLAIDPMVLFPAGGNIKNAVMVVRFGDEEFVRILSLADMNLAFWTGSSDPVPVMKLDGTRDGLPNVMLSGSVEAGASSG